MRVCRGAGLLPTSSAAAVAWVGVSLSASFARLVPANCPGEDDAETVVVVAGALSVARKRIENWGHLLLAGVPQ